MRPETAKYPVPPLPLRPAPRILILVAVTLAALCNCCGRPGGLVVQQAIQQSVTLNWNASSTSSVVGYNVYRSGTPGGPYSLLTGALVPGTAYTDGNVSSGATYYYVVTSVDSSGSESAFSNEVSATVPSS